MTLYRSQTRTLSFDPQTPPPFPNEPEFTIELQPSECFGVGMGPSSTVIFDLLTPPLVNIRVNAYTGRVEMTPNQMRTPIGITILFQGRSITIEGNRIIVRFGTVKAIEEIGQAISFHESLIPSLLNLIIPDSPYVTSISGRIGDVAISWQFYQSVSDVIQNVERSIYAQTLTGFVQGLTLFGNKNERLYSALHHFHVACRLRICGNTLWEFMPECILNLAKVLETLFRARREDIRTGLRTLGISDEIIEQDFIPLIVLRNEFGVAHVSRAIYPDQYLTTIFRFTEFIEAKMRGLLCTIVNRSRDGSFALPEADTDPAPAKVKMMEKLVANMKRRLPKLPLEHLGQHSTGR